MFGLTKQEIDMIIEQIVVDDKIEKVVIFGSRAMGNYKRGSDIDMAVFGKEVDNESITRLHFALSEEIPLPYEFDVLNYDTIGTLALKEHIDREGKVMWEKQGMF